MPDQNNPHPVKVRQYSFEQLVNAAGGEDQRKKDTAYEFSNGRKFDDPGADGGAYAEAS